MEDDKTPETVNVPEPNAPSETPPDTLEDIAREFSVEDQANQFNAQPQPALAPNAPARPAVHAVPDPVTDPEGYRAYMADQANASDQISNLLGTIAQRLEKFETSQLQQKVEADLKAAVSKVNESLKVDPMLAEIALEKMYRTDANFKKIWDNRERNPQAYQKALGVIAQKLAPTFAVRQDPQLTENQRAAQASTRTLASHKQGDYDPRHKALYEPESQAEFDQAWEAFKKGLG